MPYCDNGNVIGTDPAAVLEVRDTLIDALRDAGFGVHEITEPEARFETLGVVVDGVANTVASTSKRITEILIVLVHLVTRPVISGKQLERVLGHITCCCILQRRFLSLLGTAYKFVRQHYPKPHRLWPSVATSYGEFVV